MPKRKRPTNANEQYSGEQIRGQVVMQKINQYVKQLHRVLKTAKSFERQKLGKRLTRAETADVKQRLNLEIEALKNLDLAKFAQVHLYKSLLKVKTFAASGLLPENVRNVNKDSAGEGVERSVLNNVISGILNMKVVKQTMDQVFKEMYHILGIAVPVKTSKDNEGIQRIPNETLRVSDRIGFELPENLGSQSPSRNKHQDTLGSPEWESFGSENSNIDKQDKVYDKRGVREDSIDQDGLEHFDSLIANDSDEESFDETRYPSRQRLSASLRPSSSNSPMSSNSSSPEYSRSISLSDSPVQPIDPPKSTSKSRAQPVKAGLSTFLPTLMGGYWSGSEESASDLEDLAPAPKKNRPGQIARRAIAEKKYGQNANHIKLGKVSVIKKGSRNDGWDPKRGAIESFPSSDRRHARSQSSRNSTAVQREMASRGGPPKSLDTGKPRRVGGIRTRDDVGTLHPSWQAAKKAKEAKQAAKFQGKKVVFD